jgi:hypothetical protein
VKVGIRAKKGAVTGVMILMAAIIPAVPANATANAGVALVSGGEAAEVVECSTTNITTGNSMDMVVYGAAVVPGATHVAIVCHLWQGTRHVHVGGAGAAGVAVAAGVVTDFVFGNYSVCTELIVTTPSGGYRTPCH